MNGGSICSLCLSWDVYLSCLLTLLLLVHRSSNWTHYIAGFFPWISSLQMAYHGTSQPLQWCEPISIINLPLYISLYTLLVCFSGEPLLIHRTTHAHPSCRDLTASSHSFKICLPLHSFHPIGLLSFHQYIKIRLSCSSSAYPLSLTQGKYYPWTPPSPARHSGFAHGTWFLSLSYPAHFNLNGFLEISFQKQKTELFFFWILYFCYSASKSIWFLKASFDLTHWDHNQLSCLIFTWTFKAQLSQFSSCEADRTFLWNCIFTYFLKQFSSCLIL